MERSPLRGLLTRIGPFDGGGALIYATLTRSPAWRARCGELVDRARLRPGERVLDLGCGPGISAFAMLDRVPDLQITGVDMSASMLRFAEHFRVREPRGAQVRLLRADATALELPDASFDVVTGHSFLYLLPEPEAVLREVRRLLRPGGRVAFMEPSSTDHAQGLPEEIWAQRFEHPRFVTAMALWRRVSSVMGRFDPARFDTLFRAAGLRLLSVEPTLGGLGLYGLGERPEEEDG